MSGDETFALMVCAILALGAWATWYAGQRRRWAHRTTCACRCTWRLIVLLATMGLRRNSAGGFGSVVPMPSSGGGRGYG